MNKVSAYVGIVVALIPLLLFTNGSSSRCYIYFSYNEDQNYRRDSVLGPKLTKVDNTLLSVLIMNNSNLYSLHAQTLHFFATCSNDTPKQPGSSPSALYTQKGLTSPSIGGTFRDFGAYGAYPSPYNRPTVRCDAFHKHLPSKAYELFWVMADEYGLILEELKRNDAELHSDDPKIKSSAREKVDTAFAALVPQYTESNIWKVAAYIYIAHIFVIATVIAGLVWRRMVGAAALTVFWLPISFTARALAALHRKI